MLPVDVVAALRETLPPGTVVDGELVVWDTATALRQRRARLEQLLFDAPPAWRGQRAPLARTYLTSAGCGKRQRQCE